MPIRFHHIHFSIFNIQENLAFINLGDIFLSIPTPVDKSPHPKPHTKECFIIGKNIEAIQGHITGCNRSHEMAQMLMWWRKGIEGL